MGTGHSHGSLRNEQHAKRLGVVLALNALYLIAEIVGAALTGSLALLADAGHMLTDAGGIALALFALRLASRAPTPQRTYGYYRAEILAALANAIVLLGISGYVLYEAYRRLWEPPEVHSGAVLTVAAVGLVVNLIGARLLRSGAAENINMRGAYLEVLADLISSLAVIVAAIVMAVTGWYYADPLVSVFIGLFILPRTWRLLSEAIGVLLEGTPVGIDVAAIGDAIRQIPGVVDVHDVHVWSLTSGMNAMSAHAVVADGVNYATVLSNAQNIITSRFPIQHVTLQVEPMGHTENECHL